MSRIDIPTGEHILTELDERGVLTITFDRPEVRNAMSLQTVREIEAVFDAIEPHRDVRVVVLCGSGGHFCAGGDIKDMAAARGQQPRPGEPDPLTDVNRRFGSMITKVDRAPQAVIAKLEGAVLGGGFGLACVADIAVAGPTARFGLPETGLGIPPAQIAPFVVRRVGLSQARRLAVTGGRFGADVALRMGLVHEVALEPEDLRPAVEAAVVQVLRCAPGAVAATKQIVLDVGEVSLERLLDRAAEQFAIQARGPEGVEGMTAFVQKRPAAWAVGTDG